MDWKVLFEIENKKRRGAFKLNGWKSVRKRVKGKKRGGNLNEREGVDEEFGNLKITKGKLGELYETACPPLFFREYGEKGLLCEGIGGNGVIWTELFLRCAGMGLDNSRVRREA